MPGSFFQQNGRNAPFHLFYNIDLKKTRKCRTVEELKQIGYDESQKQIFFQEQRKTNKQISTRRLMTRQVL